MCIRDSIRSDPSAWTPSSVRGRSHTSPTLYATLLHHPMVQRKTDVFHTLRVSKSHVMKHPIVLILQLRSFFTECSLHIIVMKLGINNLALRVSSYFTTLWMLKKMMKHTFVHVPALACLLCFLRYWALPLRRLVWSPDSNYRPSSQFSRFKSCSQFMILEIKVGSSKTCWWWYKYLVLSLSLIHI